MVYLVGGVNIMSGKSLGAVAEIISQRLFGGVRFVGRDEAVYDEVPAVYAERSILGMSLILQGFGGEDGYFLEMYPEEFPKSSTLKEAAKTTDVSEFLAFLLEGVEGIKVSRT